MQMKRSESKLILFGQVTAGLMSLVAVTITAKYVGPEVFGFCSVVILLLIMGMTMVDFGACAWASRGLATQAFSVATYRHVMKSKTKINLIFVLLTPGFIFFSPNNYKWSFILFVYPALWNRFYFIQQFLITTNKVKESVFLIILERTCWLLVLPMSLLGVEKVLAFSIPILFGLFLHGIFGSRLLLMQENNELPDCKFNQLELFKESGHFGIISLSGAMSNLDGFLVATVSSITESANYILAQRFRNPLTIVFTSVATRIRPIAAKRDLNLIRSVFREDANLLRFGFSVNLIIAILSYFYSEYVFGTSFEGIGWVMFFGTLTSIPLGVVFLSTNLLSAIGHERFVSRANTIYAGSTLSGAVITAHYFGSLGAVVTVFFIVLIYAIVSSLQSQKQCRLLS